jgi:hypothetical protein
VVATAAVEREVRDLGVGRDVGEEWGGGGGGVPDEGVIASHHGGFNVLISAHPAEYEPDEALGEA